MHTCSGGLLKAGEIETAATRSEPDRISLSIPLIPSSNKVLAPSGEPLAHVERSLIKPCKTCQVRIQIKFANNPHMEDLNILCRLTC